ncbi:hypothetical protein KAU08_00260, partial [bacterium]|nr:hypothetical protein [bacterium]
MLQKTFRIYLILMLLILLGCDRGGNILMVGSISGPGEVPEGTTVEFRVNAEGDSGITCFWVVNPTEFGILSNPNSKSTTFTAPEIDADFEIVIRVVVNSDNDGPVIRSTNVTIVDIGEPYDGDNGDNGDDDDPPPINHPPTAAAHVSSDDVELGTEINFFDDSTDPDGNDDIVLWEWDFSYHPDVGFQVESEDQEPVHVYDEDGTYSIQLRVVDSGGISDMLDSPIEIVVEEIFIFNPQELNRIGFGFRTTDIEMRGDYVFMIAPGYGFNVVNISNPEQPFMVTSLELEHRFDWLEIDGPYAYALGEDNAVVQIINIEDPEAPCAVNNIQLTGTGMAIAVQDGYAYITLEYDGVWIIDVDPPEDAHVIQNVDLTTQCTDIDIDGEYAVVISKYPYPSVMHILDIDPPETAYLVNTIESGTLPQCVKLKQGYAFICLDQYLKVYDIAPPESAHFVSQLKIHRYSTADIAMVDDYIYVLDSAFYIFHFNFETNHLGRVSTDLSSVDGSVFTTDGNLVCSSVYESLFVHEIELYSPSMAPLRGLLRPMYIQDIAVSDDQLFIVTDDLIVFDVSNPEFPQFLLNWADFSGLQYKRIVVDQDLAYMLDNPDNPENTDNTYLKIVNISSMNDAFTVEEFQILGNKGIGDLVFEDGYLYITSNRGWLNTGGLEILDVDPPEST